MNIEEFLESKSPKAVSSEDDQKSVKRASKPVRRVKSSGASIGDGMRTTAKVAAVTTIFTILVHSAPMLFAAIVGGIMLMKGCHPPAPVPLSSVPSHASLPIAPLSVTPTPSPKVSPRMAKLESEQVAGLIAEPDPQPLELDQTPLQDRQQPDSLSEQSPPQVVPQHSPTLLTPAPQFSPFARVPTPNQPLQDASPFIPNRLASPDIGRDPIDMVDAAVFDFRRGRTYVGTCQMPDASSKRMSLSVDSIRDRGTNIQARLVLLESPRTSKKYSGTVQNNPPRLILTPVGEGNGFGTFLTFMPWYSNSPTAITLEMGKDGMRLEGTSVSSEQFDLVARSEITRPSHNTTQIEFNGFDTVDANGSTWNIQKIDSKTVEPSKAQAWSLTALEEGVGTFVWTEGNKTLAIGTYKEDINENSLDIIVTKGTQPRVFHALAQVMNDSTCLQVCVPKEPGTPRPKQVSSENARVYQIVLDK